MSQQLTVDICGGRACRKLYVSSGEPRARLSGQHEDEVKVRDWKQLSVAPVEALAVRPGHVLVDKQAADNRLPFARTRRWSKETRGATFAAASIMANVTREAITRQGYGMREHLAMLGGSDGRTYSGGHSYPWR